MSDKFEGLPVIDADEAEQITAAVRSEDIEEGDPNYPEQHPIAIALRRQEDIDDRASDRKRNAGPAWQEVVPLRRPRQVQAFAERPNGAGKRDVAERVLRRLGGEELR
jgi:hypothetical protein